MASDFGEEFLGHYLQLGLGAMPKADVDALVMHLLDKHGYKGSPPLSTYGNQAVSELLKTPVAKVKKLRYDAALKFGGRVEDQAKARLLAALSKATLEADGDKVCLVIEDALAKNWLQGQLKNNQLIFEHSFNSEIVRVSSSGLFSVLGSFFDKTALEQFEAGYEAAKKKSDAKAVRDTFRKVASKFAEGAAKSAGAGVLSIFKAHVGVI